MPEKLHFGPIFGSKMTYFGQGWGAKIRAEFSEVSRIGELLNRV